MTVSERFLAYVAYDTRSDPDAHTYPSTEGQQVLGERLRADLEALGLADVRMDSCGYVYGTIPANRPDAPVFGLLAHMDTAPEMSGRDVKPRIVENYQGGDIPLHKDLGIVMKAGSFPELARYIGHDLIVTDGTTLLGADNKAGVAEIITMAQRLMEDPGLPHGEIRIAFTPDEEIGMGTRYFDVENFGAEFAYTVDGGAVGELEYENFNAAEATVTLNGFGIHPGSARGVMVNAILLGMEFQAMLPAYQVPQTTDGHEGFYHLNRIAGGVEQTVLHYILRDHDGEKLEEKKALMRKAAGYMEAKYGAGAVALELTDAYRNMREKLLPERRDVLEYAAAAMRSLCIEPFSTPIRGGTDGARLSWEGLPCPNLCTGGHNAHGRYEFVSIQAMEQVVEILIRLAGQVVEHPKHEAEKNPL